MKNKVGDVAVQNQQEQTFYGFLKATFNIARVFGTIPISLIFREDSGRSRYSKTDLYYTLLYFSFYLLLSSYCVYKVLVEYDDGSTSPKNIIAAESLLSMVPIFVNLAGGYIFRNILVRSVTLMTDVDFLATKMRLRLVDNPTYTRSMLIFMSISIVIRSSLIIGTVRIDFLQQLMIFLTIFMTTFPKYHFAIIILAIQTRVVAVNREIQNCTLKLSPREFCEKLRALCRLHYRLCDVSRSMNTSFGAQLLFSVAASSASILLQAYYLYVSFPRATGMPDAWLMTRSIVCMVKEFVDVYLLAYVCNKYCDVANQISVILHKLRNDVVNDIEIERHIQMHSLQILHQRMQFSAMGFFDIDYSLLYAMSSNLVTYLVIAIQFDQNKDSGNTKNVTLTYVVK